MFEESNCKYAVHFGLLNLIELYLLLEKIQPDLDRVLACVWEITWHYRIQGSCAKFGSMLPPETWREKLPVVILLMEEILHHQGCLKPCKWWDKLPINWCRITSINSSYYIYFEVSHEPPRTSQFWHTSKKLGCQDASWQARVAGKGISYATKKTPMLPEIDVIDLHILFDFLYGLRQT